MHRVRMPVKYWGVLPTLSWFLKLLQCVAVAPSIVVAIALPSHRPSPPLLVDCCILPQCALLPWQEGVAVVAEWRRYKKLSNSLVVTRWTPRMPVNPTHTIGGTQHVGWVLGEGGVSLACCVCHHALCGGTSADDSGSFVIVFKHGRYFFWVEDPSIPQI